MFLQMSLHILLLSQVPACSLAPPHSPAPSLGRHRRSTTADLGSSLKFLSRQRACTSQSRLLPHYLPWVLKPSMFFAYFSVLPTDVDRWEGPSDDTDRFRFSVCSPGRIKVAWIMNWSRFSSLFDIRGEYHGQRSDKPFPMMRDKEGGC